MFLPIPSQFDSFDFTSEFQFDHALGLRVIPEHHFVWWRFRVLATSHERQVVCSLEHFHDRKPSVRVFYSRRRESEQSVGGGVCGSVVIRVERTRLVGVE